ncbi:hypothetical protein F5X68DRAFT_272125 [Plectosphaerella plurivora]|uniref:Uncharacterized protein n=1 Tax=Plectosphaerella plurivora TaxID=936078 RepID=A0A9P9AI54_9PEZI|nr:hypothetical protein F5X68DRAFT_272125 [Plectosphaerella plurivora]
MESSSEVSERSGSSLSWSDCNDTPAERNEDWDFVLPRSKTHVVPDFSASEEEGYSPAQDCGEDYQLVQGQEEDHHPAQGQEEDQQPAQDHEKLPSMAASPEPSNIEAGTEDQTQTDGAESESGNLDCSSTLATDETALNESYFTKEEALKSLRAEFYDDTNYEAIQLADAEGWLDYLYETLAPSFPPKETELDKDMRQLSVAIFLESQLKLCFYPGDSPTLKAIAYRHILRPSNARVAKLLYELSQRAKFTCQSSHIHLKWPISGLQQQNQTLQETVAHVEQMNQRFVEDNDKLKKKNLELEKKNFLLANKNYLLEKKNDQLFMKIDQVDKKNEQLEKKNDELKKENDELEKLKRKFELFEDRLNVETGFTGTFDEGIRRALATALDAFSQVFDNMLVEKIETSCKCPQDSAPKAEPSIPQVEAAQKPAHPSSARRIETDRQSKSALPSSVTRAAVRAAAVKERNDRAAERAAAIKERHDRANRRVAAMKGENTKAIDSARIKAQKNAGDRGAWLQSGSS